MCYCRRGFVRIEKCFSNNLKELATTAIDWSISNSSHFFKGALIWTGVQTALTQGLNLKYLYQIFFQNDFRIDKYELKESWEKQIAQLKAEGATIPNYLTPDSILWADCPKKEYLKQLSIVFQKEFTPFQLKCESLFLNLMIPIAEETFFRGLIQDVVLTRLVSKVVKRNFADYASMLDSKIYTGIRILLTSLYFSYAHRDNRLVYADRYVDQQLIATLVQGVGFGILKETHGLAASVGAHATNNFVWSIPGVYAAC